MPEPRPDTSDSPKRRDIRQVVPATGHRAVYFDEETGEPWTDPVVAWGLLVDWGNASPFGAQPLTAKLVGLVPDVKEIVPVDEFPNFLGYMSPGGKLKAWKEEALRAWKERQGKLESGDISDEAPMKKLWLYQADSP